eukprot:CAMPEP_0182887736 /NCGR_PEP_ID=MMETSP0034_2-20130328/21005_1 /TAXON_ID=156128 /ORGANISM="Nephroselmis pyriformis, Strain CCMP717" /LENGTH=471 /DNA_ID=CAMNT_0025021115 /DNA_START=27 /DNA_END=1442 /DNA_ORIENTATION=-
MPLVSYDGETALPAGMMEATEDDVQGTLEAMITDLNSMWLLLGAYLVFFMQCGFALLEAGSVRSKNTKNILLKNVLDACVGAMLWWAFGYSFAYGGGDEKQNKFIGVGNFLMSDNSTGEDNGGTFYAGWLFQWAFAATAATIVSGAVAERCQFRAYIIYTVILTVFIYPVAVHWGWSNDGWLSAFYIPSGEEDYNPDIGGQGLIDFAGSGIVHMTGGGAALMGAYFLGPRYGRFRPDGTVVDLPGHSTVLCVLGTFILWFGWYGFNPVSTLAIVGVGYIAGKVAVTTTLAAGAGGFGTLLIHVLMGNPPDVAPALNGILGGLVAITAPCSVVEPYGAIIIGLISAPVYYFSSMLLKKMQIDDPLDASPVHFFCGAWGVLSAGLFATEANTMNAYGTSSKDWGAFYGGGGKQFGVQCLGVFAFAAWTCVTSGIMFFIMSKAGIFRVSHEDEVMGLDESHHGGSAYDIAHAVK